MKRLVCLFGFALILLPAQAQYAVPAAVLSSGWAVAEGTTYRIAGTFGQPVVGRAEGSQVAELGFWFTTEPPIHTAIEPPDGAVPQRTRLLTNYPNPFNPTTTIPYELSTNGPVRLAVYDLLGREVARLVDRVQSAGRYEAVLEAADLPSGVYVYRLETEEGFRTRPLTLVK